MGLVVRPRPSVKVRFRLRVKVKLDVRSGTLHIGCGVSVDTRVALEGDGGGRCDTLGAVRR